MAKRQIQAGGPSPSTMSIFDPLTSPITLYEHQKKPHWRPKGSRAVHRGDITNTTNKVTSSHPFLGLKKETRVCSVHTSVVITSSLDPALKTILLPLLAPDSTPVIVLNVDDVEIIGGRKHGFFPKCWRHDGTRLTPTQEVLLRVVDAVAATAAAAAIAVEHKTLYLSLSLPPLWASLIHNSTVPKFLPWIIPTRNVSKCWWVWWGLCRWLSSRVKRDGMWMDGWTDGWPGPLLYGWLACHVLLPRALWPLGFTLRIMATAIDGPSSFKHTVR